MCKLGSAFPGGMLRSSFTLEFINICSKDLNIDLVNGIKFTDGNLEGEPIITDIPKDSSTSLIIVRTN